MKTLIKNIFVLSIFLGSILLVSAQELLVEDFNANTDTVWTFYDGAEFPGATGSFSVEPSTKLAQTQDNVGNLYFNFEKGGAYVEAALNLKNSPNWNNSDIDKKLFNGFSIRILRPDGCRVVFRVRDSIGQTFQKPLRCNPDIWCTASATFNTWNGFWGGDPSKLSPDQKDNWKGTLHYPITYFELLADVGEGLTEGNLLFDDLVFHKDSGQHTARITYSLLKVINKSNWWGTKYSQEKGIHFSMAKNKRSGIDFPDRTLPGIPEKFTFSGKMNVKTLSDNLGITLSLHTHFMTFYKDFELTPQDVDSQGNFKVSVAAPPGNGWNWAGGENDGQLHGQLRSANVRFRNNTSEDIEIQQFNINVTASSPKESVVQQHATVSSNEKNINFIWNALLVDSTPLSGELTCILKNWNGDILSTQRTNITLQPDLEKFTQVVSYPIPRDLNFVEATFYFTAKGQNAGDIYAAWLENFPRNDDFSKDPDSPFGMGVYLYRFGDDQIDAVAHSAAQAGVKWTREEFNWGMLAPRKGEYNWEHFDTVVDSAERYGIQVYGVAAYWAGWVKPYTEEGIVEYLNYLKTIATRYKGRIYHWEIWNEPNIFFWQGTPEMYADLLSRSYKTLKEVDPNIQVLGLSTAGIDFDFIEKMTGLKVPFDILTIHPYRSVLKEAELIKDLQRADSMVLTENGKHKPIWNTEIGWATHTDHPCLRQDFVVNSERKQAEFIARTHLTTIGSGVNPKNFWYNFRNDGEDPWYFEHNMGITYINNSPKPAYAVYSAMTATLKNTKFDELKTLDNERYVAYFKPVKDSGKAVIAIWQPKVKQSQCIDIKEYIKNMSDSFEISYVSNAIGEQLKLTDNQEVIHSLIAPIYVVLKNK